MTWNTQGTINVTNDSAVVYGSGTNWASDGLTRAGDTLLQNGALYQVQSIQSDTQLTLASPWLGTTQTGIPYAIIHTGMLPAELAQNLINLQSSYLTTVSQLYAWETSQTTPVPLTNPATGVTQNVQSLPALLMTIASVASAAVFSNNAATTTGLTYGYVGGYVYSNGANIAIPSGTVALTASTTNYVQRTAAGVVSVNTTGFTPGLIPMATVVAGANTITTITDNRPAAADLRGVQSIALAGANITLTDAQVNTRIIRFTGTLTANVVVTFPAYAQEWVLSNETTGAFTVQVETSNGSPITLLQGVPVIVYGNGSILVQSAAPMAGNASQAFSVANASAPANAVPLAQAESLFAPASGSPAYAPASGSTAYAPTAGNASQTFNVAPATTATEAVQYAQTLVRPNVCPDVDQWYFVVSGGTIANGYSWGKYAYYANLANGSQTLAVSPLMPCAGGATYVITGDSRLSATTADAYFDLQFYDSTGANVLDGPQNPLAATHDFATDNSNRNANAVQVTAPSTAVTMQARFVVDATNAVTATGFRQVKVERGTLPATPYTQEADVDALRSFVATGTYTVATLPAGTSGQRAFVTDATAPSFLQAVTGGGTVGTPVFYNGSAWIVG